MIVITDDEDEDIEVEPQTTGYYFVQVFPSDQWTSFPITESTIQKGLLTEQVKESLTKQCNLPELPEKLEYDVRVIRDKNNRNRPLDSLKTLKGYDEYVDQELSRELTRLLNDDEQPNEASVPIDPNTLKDASIVITVAPRSFASLYEIPPLPESMGYQVEIFDGTAKELGKAIEYHNYIDIRNKNLDEPLPLVSPTYPGDFVQPDHVVFLAKKDGRIIGYASFVLLRQRAEIASLVKAQTDNLLTQNTSAESRYLMGETPGNIFEIEGLSADPGEAGKNIGFALLYHGMRFIRDPLIHCLYPVTHLGAQSASYITKRLLTMNYGFRYHGSNMFMNEHFLETLDDATKIEFLEGITKQITFYNNLFKGSRFQTLKDWVTDKPANKNLPLFNEMARNVIYLYQLLYLAMGTVTSRNACILEPVIQDALAAFVTLFDNLVRVLPRRHPLRDYFENNALAIRNGKRNNGQSADVLKLIKATIYTRRASRESEVAFTLGDYSNYGFLYKDKPNTPKVVIRQAYDVIYNTLLNMIAISNALNAPNVSGLVLNNINELLIKDLNLPYNYELPAEELPHISNTLNRLLETGALSQQQENLKTVVKLIKDKDADIGKNEAFNKQFSTEVYEVPKATSGLDTFISLKELDALWEQIERGYENRVGLSREAPIIGPDMDVEDSDIDVFGNGSQCPVLSQSTSLINSPPLEFLEMPTSAEELQKDIDELYTILLKRPSDDATFTFKGNLYTTVKLKEHFNRLKEMLDKLPLVMAVEEEEDEPLLQQYRLEDFIDDNLLGEGEDYYSILDDLNIT